MIFMTGMDPNEITVKYHEIIGKPVHIPMWALGWHQSRQGYKSTTELRSVVQGYKDNQIPLEAQWSDADYMQDYRMFTYDNQNITYQGLPDFVNDLHSTHQRYVPVLDTAIAQRFGSDYPAYTDGVAKDVFIKDQGGVDNFVGE